MMKKYRIKNEDVEKAVRELFKTEEIYQSVLNDTCDKQFRDYFNEIVIEGNPTQAKMGFRFSIGIEKKLIEEVVEYNPKKWNQWPQVRPIKKGNYRIEHDENGYTYKFGFYWNGHFWEGRKGYGPICSNTFQDGFRFKPWYDEWEDRE